MLVLSRKEEEVIVIGDNIRLIVGKIGASKVKLVVDVPKGTRVMREEVQNRKANRKEKMIKPA